MKNRSNLLGIALILAFTAGNIIQSITTELLYDEAYYWVQSHFLDWGYFDHPPMTSLWIKPGTVLFSNELGVRIGPALAMSLTVYLIWLLIDHPKKKENIPLFGLLIFSTALFNLYGFLALPDTFLFFFTALFLFAYKKVITTEQWVWYGLLSLSIAGLLYSKYTAVILILFVFSSNLALLKKLKFWTAVVGAILLFTPHLYWQYSHEFPTFTYHVLERSARYSFKLKQAVQYVLNQMAIIGFSFPIFFLVLFRKKKTVNLFEKALVYFVMGYLLFVFILSFRIKTQAQWTSPILIPFMILAFTYLVENDKYKKLFIRLALINCVLLIGIRVVIAVEGLVPVTLETHGNKKWALAIQQQFPNHKKLFHNSYRRAATYWFYTKDTASTYNSSESRKNQFNLLAIHHNWTANKILHISENPRKGSHIIHQKNEKFLYLTPIKRYRCLPNDLFKIESIQKDETQKERWLLRASMQHNYLPGEQTVLHLAFKGIKNNQLGSTPLDSVQTSVAAIEGHFVLPDSIEWQTVRSLEIAAYLNAETELESLSTRKKIAPALLD